MTPLLTATTATITIEGINIMNASLRRYRLDAPEEHRNDLQDLKMKQCEEICYRSLK